MKCLIMCAWLHVCRKSIEVKESFKFTILNSLKFLTNSWLAIFKVSTVEFGLIITDTFEFRFSSLINLLHAIRMTMHTAYGLLRFQRVDSLSSDIAKWSAIRKLYNKRSEWYCTTILTPFHQQLNSTMKYSHATSNNLWHSFASVMLYKARIAAERYISLLWLIVFCYIRWRAKFQTVKYIKKNDDGNTRLSN